MVLKSLLAWWVSHPVRLAALAVVVGGGFACLAAFGVMALMMDGGQNYRHTGFLGDVIYGMFGAMAGFWLGAYMTVGAVWALDEAPRGPSPGVAATAAMVGGALGAMLASLLTAPLYALSHGLGSFVGMLVSPPGALAGAVGGVVLSMRLVLPRWRRRTVRLLHLAVPTLATLAALVALGVPHHDFPGGEAPIAERRAWAAKTFGARYEDSEAFLRRHAGVRSAIGEVRAVGPVPGPNHTSSSPGEMMGTFTLQVVGDRGEGVAHLEFMHDNGGTGLESYHFKGTFKHPGKPVPLKQPSDGEV